MHTTTVWEWLNTVVLRREGVGMGVERMILALNQPRSSKHGREMSRHPQVRGAPITHMLKHPWHLTSMK